MPDRALIRRHRAVIGAAALGHLCAAGLILANRAGYTVDARSHLLQALAQNPVWLASHIAAALALGFLIVRLRFRSWLMNFSAIVMLTWSVILLWWGWTALRPVSLLGPVFGCVCAIITLTLSRSMAPDD